MGEANIQGMFKQCTSLSSIQLSSFITDYVINMSEMFYKTTFTSLDISNFITSKVTDMSYMFYGCNYLTSLSIINFVTSKVTNMSPHICSLNALN